MCNSCSPDRASLETLGYLGPQRICQYCMKSKRFPRKRSTSTNTLYEKAVPPVQRSDVVLFSPPACPEVQNINDESSEEIVQKNLTCFDFDLFIYSKTYNGITISAFEDRMLVTAFSTEPPLRACKKTKKFHF